MKRPKKLWIGFSSETKSGCYRVYEHDPNLTYAKPYHLHPGNEVKLKRENARYRRWLKVLVNPMSIATRIETWTEIRRVMPEWFKGKRRGSK